MKELQDTSALILAGGLGTRLRSALADVPKVLAPVLGRPFLYYLLDQLAEHGARQAVLLVGYRADQVRDAIGNAYRGMRIEYSQEPSPLGTAGALRAASRSVSTPELLLLNGDSYCRANLSALLDLHRERDADACVTLTRAEETARFGSVQFDPDARVTAFTEKSASTGPGWINAGVYCLQSHLLEEIPSGRAVSLEKEMLPPWIERGRVRAYCCTEPLLDIGTPESYRAANEFLRRHASPVVGCGQ